MVEQGRLHRLRRNRSRAMVVVKEEFLRCLDAELLPHFVKPGEEGFRAVEPRRHIVEQRNSGRGHIPAEPIGQYVGGDADLSAGMFNQEPTDRQFGGSRFRFPGAELKPPFSVPHHIGIG
ncbi:hypothetical protein SDC9_114343 [bioreactor metagenome]|uniref:Uncharacterized protein n=1 Tax=bioreactor metagenome TaxID=1076179 RepID=A0A645BS33_9ZZZZ